MRHTGIHIIGDVPWGTHFCQFYQDQQDLIDILVPYFKAGLENNEFCMWITSEPLRAEEAKAALAREVDNLDDYLRNGQIEILDYSEWYTVGGRFEAGPVLQGWVDKLEAAREARVRRAAPDRKHVLAREVGLAGLHRVRSDGGRRHRPAIPCWPSAPTAWRSAAPSRSWTWSATTPSRSSSARVNGRSSKALSGRGSKPPCAKARSRSRAATLAAEIGVWSWTPGTNDVVVSGNWRQLFGIAPDTRVTFETWRDALHPDDRDRAILELNAASEQQHDFDTEYRVVWPDGTVRWLVDRGRASYDAHGRPIRMAGVNVDITARKRAEEALRQQREWLKVTLTSIGDAVLATDTAGRITFLNGRAAESTGWTEEEALGRPVQEVFRIINERTREEAEDIVGRVLREGCVVSLANHTSLVARDGREVPIEDSAAPIRDGAGNVSGVVLVFHEVTEKRRAQEALRQSEQRVRLKLESILSPEGDIGNLELGDIIDAPGAPVAHGRFL